MILIKQFHITMRILLPENDLCSSTRLNGIKMSSSEPYCQGTHPSNFMQVPHHIVFKTLKVCLDSYST